MTAIEFIKNIKNTNEAAKFYFIEKQVFTDDDSGNNVSEWLPEVYFTEEEARTAIANLLPTLKAEFGEYLSINLESGTVEPEDLEDVDWESVDELGEAWFDNADLFEIIRENESMDDIEYFYVEYEYESLEGCILVFWSWQTHVGYCRKCEEIRYAYSDETSKMCILEDRCYRTQCSVLCEAKELEGLSREDINNLVNQKLGESHWKWQNNAYRIAEYACL
jgi:hypothetical protein